MCAKQSESCLQSNSSSADNLVVYSTATQPIELYERRCTLNRSDWKFAYENLYEGPHNTIVDEVNLKIRIPFGSLYNIGGDKGVGYFFSISETIVG